MKYQAHRGVCSENPENTIPAFMAAINQGFDIIELDIGVTCDMQFVALHDSSLKRTARNPDGSTLEQDILIENITYSKALEFDYGIWFGKKFKNTKIPLFEDILKLAQKHGTELKIDNKYQYYTDEQKDKFFNLLKPYTNIAQLTCSKTDELKRALKALPDMHFHYDGVVNDEIMAELSSLLPKDKLTIWMPFQNNLTTWVTVPFADEENCKKIKEIASLGLWILTKETELEAAKKLGADVIETVGQLKPQNTNHIKADMHTHSEFSHDSLCPIEEMLTVQKEKGVNIFAVTDHIDVDSFNKYDIFTPIQNSVQTAKHLNKKYNGIQVILGVEIGEGFRHPQQLEKIYKLCDFDVIIGSVHLVRYKNLTDKAYSSIDFSKFTDEEITEYLDAYFDDVLTMLETTDFDILAHLTCPLRYISGKYQRNTDMEKHQDKIELILRKTIEQGKALEINSSCISNYGFMMPSEDIIKKYIDIGGYLFTYGSDAHVAKNAASGMDEVYKLLINNGINSLYYYKNRQPIKYNIQEEIL